MRKAAFERAGGGREWMLCLGFRRTSRGDEMSKERDGGARTRRYIACGGGSKQTKKRLVNLGAKLVIVVMNGWVTAVGRLS